MKKLLKLIPLVLVSFMTIGCGGGTSVSEPTSEATSTEPQTSEEQTSQEATSEELTSEETSEEKALREAKETAEAFIAATDVELYRGQEKEELEALLAGLANLINTATNPAQINAAIASIEEYLATAKTKAEYEAEEAEEARIALEAKRAELLAHVAAVGHEYRAEEREQYETYAAPYRELINAKETMTELEQISFTEFDAQVAALPTQAEYTVDELLHYPLESKWDLVNDHIKNWEQPALNKIYTPNDNGNAHIAYALSQHKYSGGFEAVIKCANPGVSGINQGLLIANINPTGTGLDGYWINYDYAADHQFLQVYYVINGYGIEAAVKFKYIGGWVYNDSYATKLTQDDIRVVYNGATITFYNNDAYLLQGEGAPHVSVPLADGDQYVVDPDGTYSFGYYNWDETHGAKSFELKEFIPEEEINGKEILSNDWAIEKAKAQASLSLYEEDEQNDIANLIAGVDATFGEEYTYNASRSAILNFRTEFALVKTHEQKETERHADVHVQILDNLYSGDTTKYTPSNWALVNEHALAWTHEQGSDTIVTDGNAGYIMDNEQHGDFTMVVKLDGVQSNNPYGGAGAGKAFIFGCEMGTNEYFNGYALVFYESGAGDNWVQLYTLREQWGIGTADFTFQGGYAYPNNGVKFRFTVKQGILKAALVNTDGSETPLTATLPGTFALAEGLSVSDYNGKFGILDWGGSASTFTLYEYRNL